MVTQIGLISAIEFGCFLHKKQMLVFDFLVFVGLWFPIVVRGSDEMVFLDY